MSSEQNIDKIIEDGVTWSAVAGVIPIPIGDFIAVTAVQLDMLKKLSKALGRDYQEMSARSFILALNASITARIGASALKAIPGFGTILGSVSMPIMAGASTYAVGKAFVHAINKYGSLTGVDMDDAKGVFKDLYEKGKEKMEGSKDKDKSSED